MADHPQLPFDAPEDDPVSVYFASGLTGLNRDQLSIVELVSGLLSEFCADALIKVHQPVLHTGPQEHPELTPGEVHAADYAKVISSDALILLADFPSWGGGIELVWAERLRIPVLLLVRDPQSASRLLRGSIADLQVDIWRFHNDLRDAWKSFFLNRKQQLETHRRLRADRQLLWGPTIARLRHAYDELSPAQRLEVVAVAQIVDRRIAEMLSSPFAFAEASIDEIQALTGALGLPTSWLLPGEPQVSLPAKSLAALQNASELATWTGSKTLSLLRRAHVELARGGTRRLTFNESQDWIDFAGDGH